LPVWGLTAATVRRDASVAGRLQVIVLAARRFGEDALR